MGRGFLEYFKEGVLGCDCEPLGFENDKPLSATRRSNMKVGKEYFYFVDSKLLLLYFGEIEVRFNTAVGEQF